MKKILILLLAIISLVGPMSSPTLACHDEQGLTQDLTEECINKLLQEPKCPTSIGWDHLSKEEKRKRYRDNDCAFLMPLQNIDKNLPGLGVDVHIYEDGRVTLTGAKVLSVAAGVINASVAWGSFTMNWAIKMDKTYLLRNKAYLSEFAVGDLFSVDGRIDTAAALPTIIAKNIRKYSMPKISTTIGGVIKSIDSVPNSLKASDIRVYASKPIRDMSR